MSKRTRLILLSCAGILLGAPSCGESLPASSPEFGGESYMTELIRENANQVPYPFEKLLRYLGSKAAPNPKDKIETVLVPKGRSLHRDKADYKSPRILAALGDQYPIFLGYAPRNSQIEIMSFNPSKAQYDFQIIQDYKPGAQPKLIPVERQLCLQCHQHGGPIFSRSPWREMRLRKPGTEEAFYAKYGNTSNIASHDLAENLIGEKILRARGGNRDYYGIDLLAYKNETRGFQGDFSRGPAASFAFNLRLKNWSFQFHSVTKLACEEDLDCRWVLLRLGLEWPAVFLRLLTHRDEMLPVMKQMAKVVGEAVRPHWPKNEFGYPSPVIPDRFVPDASDQPIVGYRIRPLVEGRDLTYYEMLGDYIPREFYYLGTQHVDDLQGANYKELFEETFEDPAVLDPKTPRPLVKKIAPEQAGEFLLQNVLEGLNFSNEDLGVLRALDLQALKKVLQSSKYRSFVKQWPPDPKQVMATILADLGRDAESKSYLAEVERQQNLLNSLPHQVASVPDTSVSYRSSKNLFVKYCATCHISGDGLEDYPLDNPVKLVKIKDFCSDISTRRMPPINPDHTKQSEWQITDQERVEMLKILGCSSSELSPRTSNR